MGAELSLYAQELRIAREESGLTREQLAEAMSYSMSLLEKVEAGAVRPSESFNQAAERALTTGGRLARIREHELRQAVLPDWFRPWAEIEQQATALRWFESTVVPGLLQIEEYARELLGDEDATAARLARQEVLARDRPPELVALLDEAVLHRRIGGREVMHRQLCRLAEASTCVQVVPAGAETYLGVDGDFVLATVDGGECVYVDTPAHGFVLDGPEIVSEIRRRWDVLRGEALPPRLSRELIGKVAQAWMSES